MAGNILCPISLLNFSRIYMPDIGSQNDLHSRGCLFPMSTANIYKRILSDNYSMRYSTACCDESSDHRIKWNLSLGQTVVASNSLYISKTASTSPIKTNRREDTYNAISWSIIRHIRRPFVAGTGTDGNNCEDTEVIEAASGGGSAGWAKA